MTETPSAHLTSGRVLARNTLWNFAGQAAPLAVAVFAIPYLIAGLGIERFGVLALAWVVVGYFSLFDLGMGRALTRLVAERLAERREAELPASIWSGLVLMTLLGIAGAAVAALASKWLVLRALTVPTGLQAETLTAFYLLAISIPIVVTTSALRGVLEGYQRFGVVNAIRVPMGIFTFAGPLLVLPFGGGLVPVVATLVAGRLIAWLAHLHFCFRTVPGLRAQVVLDRNQIPPLLRSGSWMAVSNIVGPLMVYLDRFLIGAVVSLAAVAYYATPFEVVTKLLVVPAAIVGVLFPAFAAAFASDRARAALLFSRGVKYVFLALFPIVLAAFVLAEEALVSWLGSEFADKSATTLRWLALGVFINALAHVPFAFLQGIGRPDMTAKLHLLELLPYLLALWWLTAAYGINGAAAAWTIRTAADALFLYWLAGRKVPGMRISLRKQMVVAGIALLGIVTLIPVALLDKILVLLLVLTLFGLMTWFLILAKDERAWLQNGFRGQFQ